MPSAFISQLNRELEAEQAGGAVSSQGLSRKFEEWFDSLPEISCNRPFAMVELEQALQTQGKYLSPILLALGWKRKRKWTSTGQYPRYWVPPTFGKKNSINW